MTMDVSTTSNTVPAMINCLSMNQRKPLVNGKIATDSKKRNQ